MTHGEKGWNGILIVLLQVFFPPFYAMQPEVLDRMTVYANNGTDSQTSLLIFSGIIIPGITFSQASYSD